MTAYEMMLSESQERMLMVLRPEKEAEARAIFDKWDLDFAIVGETIPEDRFLILHGNEVKADLPLRRRCRRTRRNTTGPGSRPRPRRRSAPIPEIDADRGAAGADRLARTTPARPGSGSSTTAW